MFKSCFGFEGWTLVASFPDLCILFTPILLIGIDSSDF